AAWSSIMAQQRLGRMPGCRQFWQPTSSRSADVRTGLGQKPRKKQPPLISVPTEHDFTAIGRTFVVKPGFERKIPIEVEPGTPDRRQRQKLPKPFRNKRNQSFYPSGTEPPIEGLRHKHGAIFTFLLEKDKLA
ncbi:hypothetical protein, partial [Croceicoccus gelatinilyticus]|uniref:hypothetical protein n=1 Tax=Croceicoccus gelatinilyticus TaxID=2835536 RepID=UPI001BCB49C8